MEKLGVEIINVNKKFGQDTVVLDNINLQIAESEFLVLLGASGCGKTTLLRIIAGLETQDSGSISIRGKDVSDTEPKNRKVAMVFQNYALYPHLSVKDNFMFPLDIMNLKKQEKLDTIERIAKILRLEDQLEKFPSQLSGGQRQRVAIGRALVRNPEVFLFDEPLSNLDARLREELRYEILRLKEEFKITTVFVTHDQNEAMTLADRVVLMKDGKIEQQGTPEDLYERPRTIFSARFLGSPIINEIPATTSLGAKMADWLKSQNAENADNLGDKVFLFRPEHIGHEGENPNEISFSFEAKVALREFLGQSLHYTLDCDGEQIRWVTSDRGFQKNDAVTLRIPVDKILILPR